jgi:hypothetical protein
MSFAYPDYKEGLIAPPHPVYLHLGYMLSMKGVMRDVSVTWKSPWDYTDSRGTLIEVSFSVEEVGGQSISQDQIKQGLYTPTLPRIGRIGGLS